MGVRFPSVVSNTIVTAAPGAGSESVLVTSPPLTLTLDFATVFIFAYMIGLTGAGTTQWAFRLRRGTTTAGTAINSPQNLPLGAAVEATFSICYFDTPGAVAGQQYSLTLSTSATGAATTQDVAIVAFAL